MLIIALARSLEFVDPDASNPEEDIQSLFLLCDLLSDLFDLLQIFQADLLPNDLALSLLNSRDPDLLGKRSRSKSVSERSRCLLKVSRLDERFGCVEGVLLGGENDESRDSFEVKHSRSVEPDSVRASSESLAKEKVRTREEKEERVELRLTP